MEAKRLDGSHVSEIAHAYTLKYDQVHYLVGIGDLDVLEDTRKFEELLIEKMSID